MSEKLFDITTVDGFGESLTQGIHAPFKKVRTSDLGGPDKVCLMLVVSLDAKDDWHYGILQNSRYFQMMIQNDGSMDVFVGVSRDVKFRKCKTTSLEDCTRRINKYISDCFAATKIASELFAVAKELTAGFERAAVSEKDFWFGYFKEQHGAMGGYSPQDYAKTVGYKRELPDFLEETDTTVRPKIENYFKAIKSKFGIKDRMAGTSTTPTYIVSVQKYLVFPGRHSLSDAAWRIQYGRPSPQSIKKYVETFNASLESDGVNSHLGRGTAIWGADIFHQRTGELVAHWEDRAIISAYKSKPMFEVVAAFPVRTVEKVEGFDQAFKQFMMHAQKVLSDYMAKEFPTLPIAELKPQEGGRYIRITRDEGVSRSAWGFVDKTNGDVLKPAGWSAPAKGARANIFDQSSWRNVGAYGPSYVRNMV
jgi:hypothetical protein